MMFGSQVNGQDSPDMFFYDVNAESVGNIKIAWINDFVAKKSIVLHLSNWHTWHNIFDLSAQLIPEDFWETEMN